MKNVKFVFLITMIGFLASCAGSNKKNSTTADLTNSLSGGTWLLTKAASAGVDVMSIFIIQKMVLNTDKTVTVTTYPAGTVTGNWSADANSLTVNTTTGTGSTYSYTSGSFSGTVFSATITIAAGTGGKTTSSTVAVEYTKQ
jgi:hypothetical protein